MCGRALPLTSLRPCHATACACVQVVARSAELSSVPLRRTEKKQLNALNHGRGSNAPTHTVKEEDHPTKVKARIQTPAQKVFILVRLSRRSLKVLGFSCYGMCRIP